MQNHERQNMSLGTKMSTARLLAKVVESRMDKTVYYWRRLGAFGTAAQPLYCNVGTAASTSSFPVVAFSLDSVHQTGQTPTVAKILGCYNSTVSGSNTDGGLFWANTVFGLSTSSVQNQQSWSLETTPINSAQNASNYAGRTGLHLWNEMKLNLYGHRTRPTTFDIVIAQFKEAYVYDPFKAAADPSNTLQMQPQAQQFYMEWIKQLTFNPIDKINIPRFNPMKVLKRYRFVIEPPQTTDADSLPNVRTVKIFRRTNRCLSFIDDSGSSTVQDTIPIQNDVDYATANRSDAPIATSVYPRGHTVMFVTATDLGATTQANVGIDVYLRSCFTSMGGG